MVSHQKEVERYQIVKRELHAEGYPRWVFVGVRRSGKSYMLFQKMQERLSAGMGWDSMLYVNFEDDRLAGFSVGDFELLLQCHAEMYGGKPMLFLDEPQVVPGWEKFARRLGDTQYEVWITGSNAKMLSSEVMTTLGGRYLVQEVYPYSLEEYLTVQQVSRSDLSIYDRDMRATLFRHWTEYLHWGGMPEAALSPVKRSYLSSVFQKIYLGDIASRTSVSDTELLRLMLKKIAEGVGNPVTYNRLANVLSSVKGKVSTPTVIKYIEQSEASWLLLRLRNINAAFAEKESACKYYFIDNGILNLFLIGGETALLENVVALSLFRRYGHDSNHQRVFYYNDNVEVDFYIPEEELAIQVSYSITQSQSTFDREVDALRKFAKCHPCRRRLVLTNDESTTLTDPYGRIEVLPFWRWDAE